MTDNVWGKWQALNLQLRDELGASSRRAPGGFQQCPQINPCQLQQRHFKAPALQHKETLRGLPETTLPPISFI